VLALIPPVVEAPWVLDRLTTDPSVVLTDVRWYLDGRSGRAAFEDAHLPGAVFVDLDHDLSRDDLDPTEGRHPLPTPEAFAAAMSRNGIGDQHLVVAYDDSGGMTAGRLVVMLRMLGRRATLLDGGLAAWPGPVERGPGIEREHTVFTSAPWPVERLAGTDDVERLADDPAAVVLDARSAERYRGEVAVVDPRPGHIPGARSAPWSDALDPATGRFRSPAQLAAWFEGLGATTAPTVVAHCGSGVSACVNLLAMERAGLAPARLYVASWSGWSADPDRPAATG
jgi:thiosulfate/3-mercaptopyruvate sulfurtransferase